MTKPPFGGMRNPMDVLRKKSTKFSDISLTLTYNMCSQNGDFYGKE